MSGVAIAHYLLANAAIVPATSVISGVVPVNTPMPAISVMQISSIERLTVAMNETRRFVTERVQVTAQAKTYVQQKTILAAIRAALPLSKTTVNGFACDSILPDLEGPDIFDADALIYMQTIDFMVRFTR